MMDAKKIFSLLSRFFLSPFHRWIIIHHDLEREIEQQLVCNEELEETRMMFHSAGIEHVTLLLL